MVADEWTEEEEPSAAGWYAVAYSWDDSEGIFVGHCFFNGKEWDEKLPIMLHKGPFSDDEEAAKWAEEHDRW